MQSERERNLMNEADEKWSKPEAFDPKKLKAGLSNPEIKKYHVFQTTDQFGKPTKEMRRAWRRFANQKKKIKKGRNG